MKIKTNSIRKIMAAIFIVGATSLAVSTPAITTQLNSINNDHLEKNISTKHSKNLKNNDLNSFKAKVLNEETHIKRSQTSMYSTVI